MRNAFDACLTESLVGEDFNSLRCKRPLRNPFRGNAMNLEPIRGVDLLTAHERHATVSWLWEGMLAAGNITLLTSVWKAGKSSLLALLLAGRGEGAVLLGRLIEAGASAVVSEEPAELWRRRARN